MIVLIINENGERIAETDDTDQVCLPIHFHLTTGMKDMPYQNIESATIIDLNTFKVWMERRKYPLPDWLNDSQQVQARILAFCLSK